MKREELLLTQEEGEKAVYEWVDKDFSVRFITIERGHWEDIVPVLAQAALAKFIRKGGVIRLHSESIEEIEP